MKPGGVEAFRAHVVPEVEVFQSFALAVEKIRDRFAIGSCGTAFDVFEFPFTELGSRQFVRF